MLNAKVSGLEIDAKNLLQRIKEQSGTINRIRLDYGILIAEKAKEYKSLQNEVIVLTRINEILQKNELHVQNLDKLNDELNASNLSLKSRNSFLEKQTQKNEQTITDHILREKELIERVRELTENLSAVIINPHAEPPKEPLLSDKKRSTKKIAASKTKKITKKK